MEFMHLQAIFNMLYVCCTKESKDVGKSSILGKSRKSLVIFVNLLKINPNLKK